MSDLIDRQSAINAIHEIKHIDCEGWELIDDIEECLKQLPSAEEQKKGKMTNREYLDSLSNMDFANFIYSKLLKIGKEYNDSVLGIAHWLGSVDGYWAWDEYTVLPSAESRWIPCKECEKRCEKWENFKI